MTARLHPDDIAAIAEAVARRIQSLERCALCDRGRDDVDSLICGQNDRGHICDECVRMAMQSVQSRWSISEANVLLLPDGLHEQKFVRSHNVDRHGGLVYAVATVPDLDVRRIKVGYTSRPIENRLESFRTASPTAALLGLWSAPRDGEDIAHRALDGRLRNTEVFHVPDVMAAVTTIDEELRRRWP